MQIGLVLSGGKSSRMGRDKSAMTIGTETMLEHSIAVMNSLNLDRVVVSGADFDIPDIFPEKGPVGGIYSAIQYLSLNVGDIVLIIPNDMPLLSSDALLRLVQQSVLRKCTFIYKQHPMPLSLYISKSVLTRLQLLEGATGMSIKYLIEADRVEELAVVSQDVFSNVNTPQELEDAIQTYNNTRS
ncbi:molybdenum cofactor guanylyltransferase [Glaciecola sp. 33A]|uniref:molybdenum cofactor guanylyltransferase n=1 Tax=Glaciecola sp. 33A TaxID=2057807 RepID=UPI000C33C63A|nr:molybdenum cofactor guanylyltransferase [Glaciecola sp. 33A]PKI02238.1 molybdenum cofactor guanylyltransferase [Glaciecola sp. 33A]